MPYMLLLIKGGRKMKKKIKIAFIITIVCLIILSISGSSAYIDRLNEYNKLRRSYNSLDTDYDSLESEHNNLESEHNTLQNKYDSKKADYNSLKSDHNSLLNRYNSLQEDYDLLVSQYSDYSESIEFRYGDGTDCQLFITPQDSSVISATRDVLGHYSDGELSWDDMRDIFDWVVDNVEYNHDTFIGDRRHCFFYPSETLDLGYGDCEDQAVLMLSMCLAEEDAFWISCVGVSYYEPGEGTIGHVFVIVNVADDKMYIFDLTHRSEPFWGDEEGWQSSSSMSEYEVISEYVNRWGYSNLKIKKIFNNKEYKTFNSNQEFYDYF
jgi:hypothetical protein